MTPLNSIGLKLTEDERILLLDQQALPAQENWVDASEPEAMIAAIKALKVRGAPLIGVSAALCLGRFAKTCTDSEELKRVALALRAARPTAVNLMWAIDRLLELPPQEMFATAIAIFHEDVQMCLDMGQNGLACVEDGDHILTHCNTGGLATAGLGTALAVIQTAWQAGKKIHVYVDETRPLLQGGRLTAWELEQAGIPYTLITDNMAAMLMQQGKIHKIFVGSDRIALNGDFANKIGTYSVAVNAHYHKIPFYPVAPYSTIDPKCATGQDIPIEERESDEVRGVIRVNGPVIWAPAQAPVYNPAFDVTPVKLLTGLITEKALFSQADLLDGALQRYAK